MHVSAALSRAGGASTDIANCIYGCSHTGEQEIPGLTDAEKPRMRGPKRASKIRKLFNLTKDDDVRKYVNTYRTVKEKDGKKHSKAPKIQRLVTPLTLQRKRHRRAIKRERISKVGAAMLDILGRQEHCGMKIAVLGMESLHQQRFVASQETQSSLFCLAQSKAEAAAYHKLLVTRLKEQRERRSESLAKKRAIRQASQASRELSQASKE